MARMGSIAALRREIARREKQVRSLRAKRDTIARKVTELDAQIADLAGGARSGTFVGRATGGGRGPARRGVGLKSMLIKMLGRKKQLTVGEAMEAVVAAGYKTSSKNFRLIVNQTLAKDPRFRQVARGTYALKK